MVRALARVPRSAAVGGAVLVEPTVGARGVLGRRHPEQRQEVAALEMRAFLAKLLAPLHIDQRRDRIGERRVGIVERGETLRLDEDRPARAEPAQRIRSEEHTSELQSLMRISYAVFCLKKKNIHQE